MDYTWEAIYNDGTTLTQYNEKGEKNGYENIDKTKLKAFAIKVPDPTPEDKNNKKVHFRLHLEAGQKLIFLRRGFVSISLATGEDRGSSYFLMVGWQQNVNGKNVQSINYLYPDGHIEQAGVFAGGDVTPASKT